MNKILTLILGAVMFSACDSSRIYEQNTSLNNELWVYDSLRTYTFDISDTKTEYNAMANIQYTNDYGYRNLYMTYVLSDTTGNELRKELMNAQLFTDKLGKPVGNSAIGSIYELRHVLFEDYQFPYKGKYQLSLQQYMRVDSLYGISGIGIRVERSSVDE